jgi:hypothetical protein
MGDAGGIRTHDGGASGHPRGGANTATFSLSDHRAVEYITELFRLTFRRRSSKLEVAQ